MSERIDFTQFLATLRAQVESQATIYLRMVTDENHTLWIGVRAGRIESLLFGPRRGIIALHYLHTIRGGTLLLDHQIHLPPTPGLPDTSTLLQLLDQAGHATSGSSSAALPQTAARSGLDSRHAESILARLEALLQEQVGPIAHMVIEDWLEELGGLQDEATLRRFIDGLTREVEGIGDARAFRAQAERLLK